MSSMINGVHSADSWVWKGRNRTSGTVWFTPLYMLWIERKCTDCQVYCHLNKNNPLLNVVWCNKQYNYYKHHVTDLKSHTAIIMYHSISMCDVLYIATRHFMLSSWRKLQIDMLVSSIASCCACTWHVFYESHYHYGAFMWIASVVTVLK